MARGAGIRNQAWRSVRIEQLAVNRIRRYCRGADPFGSTNIDMYDNLTSKVGHTIDARYVVVISPREARRYRMAIHASSLNRVPTPTTPRYKSGSSASPPEHRQEKQLSNR